MHKAELCQEVGPIKVFALGGLGEIGKNMYVVEEDDELIIIDSGILFPDTGYGVDYAIPDYTYLKVNQHKIKALFITHGHEDHIGGIPYLLREVQIPTIYAAGIAVKLIQHKLDEAQLEITEIREYTKNDVIRFNHFTVGFFRTNHSIPDSFGISIKTRLGYIVHTGDFKFDFSPLSGHTEYSKLTKMAEAGTLCLLSDSTNARVSRFSSTERQVGSSIKSIFKRIEGRIIISTFASNVHRVGQIINASIACGRKVVVFGRSMEKIVSVAREIGYFNVPDDAFVTGKDYQGYRPEELTIITTGSQGETLAALSRIADGSHRHIKIMEGDTVVFSSSAIPGNQESINRTINKLYKAGAKVIINSPMNDTHTSGHASDTELQLMLSLVRPKYFIPIHGEFAMQFRHVELAVATGVQRKNCFILENGDVVNFTEEGATVEGTVKTGVSYIDSEDQIIDSGLIRERRSLSEEGLVMILYRIGRDGALIAKPTIETRGFIYIKNSQEFIDFAREKASDLYYDYFDKKMDISIQRYISNEFSTYLSDVLDRYPIVMPIFIKPEDDFIMTKRDRNVREEWKEKQAMTK